MFIKTVNGMAIKSLVDQLIRDEGVVLHEYKDHLGYSTIGIGRLIDKRKGGGISLAEARFLLNNDIVRVSNEVRRALPWSEKLDEERFCVLLNMAFQMGITGLLGFKNTLAMIERGDYRAAAKGMLNSKWATQTPARCKRLSIQMETGEFQ